MPVTAVTEAPVPGQKDDIYYWQTVCFSVEGYLFHVARYHFIVGSDYFAKRFNLHNRESDESSNGVVMLEEVSVAQFRTFLKLVFPMLSTSTTLVLSREEWLTILTLSTMWRFHEFRKLAIQHLEPEITDPIELIQLGRAAYVSQWVFSGYEALVLKPERISEGESDAIGDRTVVRLYIARHDLSEAMRNGLPYLVDLELRAILSEELAILNLEERERMTKMEVQRHLEEMEELRQHEEAIRVQEEEERARVQREKEEAEQKAKEEAERMEQVRLQEAEQQREEQLERERKAALPMPEGAEIGGVGEGQAVDNAAVLMAQAALTLELEQLRQELEECKKKGKETEDEHQKMKAKALLLRQAVDNMIPEDASGKKKKKGKK